VNVYRKAFAEHLEWLVTMAMTPGWWQHSRRRARELEVDESRAFIGITEAVRVELKRRGFKPAEDELKDLI